MQRDFHLDLFLGDAAMLEGMLFVDELDSDDRLRCAKRGSFPDSMADWISFYDQTFVGDIDSDGIEGIPQNDGITKSLTMHKLPAQWFYSQS